MSTDRWFPYRAWPDRPYWRWPNGSGLAVWIVVNIEHFEFGKLGTAIQPHLTSLPEIANYGWRDYGNRVGLWRLFELFEAYPTLKITAALNADICRLYPAIVAAIKESGWEVMAHGLNNSTGQAGLALETERSLIRQTLETIELATGQKPVGWLTPGFSITARTFDLLQTAGVRYLADWVNDDQPYYLSTEDGRLVAVPYSLETNDITLCLSGRYTGPEFSQAMRDQFDQLYLESQTGPARVYTLGLHPFIVGQPLRLRYMKEVLDHIAQTEECWSATGGEIAAHFDNLDT